MKSRSLGRHDGQEIIEVTLENDSQRISLMNYGCVIRDWQVLVKGVARPVVLGFEDFAPYPEHSPSFGIIAGRVANRTAQGRFELEGIAHQLATNNGKHHLHGGPVGLGKCVWQIQSDSHGEGVLFQYHSPEGEQGYPGSLDIAVHFYLQGNTLCCDMSAMPDRPTPVNLAQHNYYNLDGMQAGDLPDTRQHILQLKSQQYLPVDEELIPTGEIADVQGSRFDFRAARKLEDADPQQLGHDHNMIVRRPENYQSGDLLAAAVLASSDRDLHLSLSTDQPGIQLYTGKKLAPAVPGLQGVSYKAFHGICLEPQHYPDALNHPEWDSIIATPDRPYHQSLKIEISEIAASL